MLHHPSAQFEKEEKKIEHAYMHDRIRAKKKMSIQDS